MSKYGYSSKSDDNTLTLAAFGVIGVLLLFVVLSIYGVWAGAFVGSHLWAWFVSPVFGLPLLTKAQAWGIALLTGYWTHQHITIPIKDERPLSEKVAQIVGLMLYPWFILLIGYVCHRFFLS